MNKWLYKGTLVAAVTALALTGAMNRAQADTCSNRSLKGDYGVTISGHLGQTQSGLLPLAGLAVTHFDGKGKLSQMDFTVVNGVPSGSEFAKDETGTYTVNSDCTGSATIHFPDGRQLDLKLVVVKGGREVDIVVSAFTVNGAPVFATTLAHGVRVDDNE
jgi:hypothetical protein